MGAVIHRCDVDPADFGPHAARPAVPGRARDVARRVAGCPLCAAEAADLAPVVAALRAYPPPADRRCTPASRTPRRGPTGLETVLAGVRAERRRHRWRAVAAAAAAGAVLALGASAARLLPDEPDRPATTPVTVRLAGDDGSQGRATLAARRWGTAIHLRGRRARPGGPVRRVARRGRRRAAARRVLPADGRGLGGAAPVVRPAAQRRGGARRDPAARARPGPSRST